MTPAPRKQLDQFIAKFTPEIAAQTKAVLAKMRARLPGAFELVYDNTYALVIGFSPTARPSDAVFSVVVYPRYLLLYFLQGASLVDPARRLKGAGKVGRHIRLAGPDDLDDEAVRELMRDAVELADEPFDATRKPVMIIRAVAQKQRPRRPSGRDATY